MTSPTRIGDLLVEFTARKPLKVNIEDYTRLLWVFDIPTANCYVMLRRISPSDRYLTAEIIPYTGRVLRNPNGQVMETSDLPKMADGYILKEIRTGVCQPVNGANCVNLYHPKAPKFSLGIYRFRFLPPATNTADL